MTSELVSTTARVRDPEQVRTILDSYLVDGVEITLAQDGSDWVLRAAFEDADPNEFQRPVALHRGQLPDEQKYPDQNAWGDALDELLQERGGEGFEALLRDLAPHVETPLLLLYADWVGTGASATVWRAQPGTGEVETLDLHLGS
jgi:hypothetical protein